VSDRGESSVGLSTPDLGLASRCLNCDAEQQGEYCSRCGQRAQDPDPTLRELVSEAWDAFVSLDGKVLASLRLLLLRPGVLTTEYLRGRRARYLPPLRLYLLCSVAYFLVSSLGPTTGPGIVRVSDSDDVAPAHGAGRATDSLERRTAGVRRDSVRRAALARHEIVAPSGPLDTLAAARADSLRMLDQMQRLSGLPAWLQQRLARGAQHVMRDNRNFSNEVAAQMPRLMFVLMPVFALLLAMAYRSRHKRYPSHLVVSLHLHAFFFAVLALDDVRARLPWSAARAPLKFVVLLWILAYVPLAIRRVYGGRLRFAAVRAGALYLEYSLVGTLAFALLGLVLVLSY
jgi:hypothetical protein